jgi:alkylated DNA repair protein alkB homolog 6
MESILIAELPSSGYYIPDFLTCQEEQKILDSIRKTPDVRWTKLSHRRLLSLPSPLTGIARDTLIEAALPNYLNNPMLPRFESLGLFSKSPHSAPNHVLINEYEPGQGIMPHEDGPVYFPITATVSLGAHTVLEIYKKTAQGERDTIPSWWILQEPRSLLITTGDMYKDTLHGIAEIKVDQNLGPETIANWGLLGDNSSFTSGSCERGTRVSLTYRDVLKVAKMGGAMKFMTK